MDHAYPVLVLKLRSGARARAARSSRAGLRRCADATGGDGRTGTAPPQWSRRYHPVDGRSLADRYSQLWGRVSGDDRPPAGGRPPDVLAGDYAEPGTHREGVSDNLDSTLNGRSNGRLLEAGAVGAGDATPGSESGDECFQECSLCASLAPIRVCRGASRATRPRTAPELLCGDRNRVVTVRSLAAWSGRGKYSCGQRLRCGSAPR